MSPKPSHDQLIEALVQNVQKNQGWKPGPPVWRSVLIWVVVSFGFVLFLSLTTSPPRPNLVHALARPEVAFSLFTLFVAMTAFGTVALTEAIPGRGRATAARRTAVISLSSAVATLCLATLHSLGHESAAFGTDPVGSECSVTVFALTLVPAIALFYRLRRLAPAHPLQMGALAALGSAVFGAGAVWIYCPVANPLHDLVWHFLPMVAITAVGGLLGRKMLRW